MQPAKSVTLEKHRKASSCSKTCPNERQFYENHGALALCELLILCRSSSFPARNAVGNASSSRSPPIFNEARFTPNSSHRLPWSKYNYIQQLPLVWSMQFLVDNSRKRFAFKSYCRDTQIVKEHKCIDDVFMAWFMVSATVKDGT